MNTEEIVSVARKYEDNPDGLYKVLEGLIDGGKATLDEIEKALEYGSAAYPYGFPGLYDCSPSFSSSESVRQMEKDGIKGAMAL